jgi:hypothetical protein
MVCRAASACRNNFFSPQEKVMKVLAAILMFVTLGVIAKAQISVTPAPARVISENNRGVKNAPFSADATNESVQILPDGNRIVRSSTSKMYRNSEGRFRQEGTGGSGGMLGSFYSFGDGVSVFSPMGGSFSLDTTARVARVFEGVAAQGISLAATAPLAALKPLEGIKLSPAAIAEIEAHNKAKGHGTVDQSSLSPAARAEIEALKGNAQAFRVDAEKFKVDAEKFRVEADKMRAAADELRVTTTVNGTGIFSPSTHSKWDTRTEELGEQNIEGVNARGTRTITTIPAGAIGNERPIETVYEKWYSTELQMIVYSKHSDPRFGEQTYKLTNINRSEPDASLFQVPTGYKVVSDGGKGTYTYTPTTKAQQVERATGVRSATTGVRKVKPQQN